MKRITIILPVYNERENLKANFPKIYSAAKKLGSFEIIIAEDGSTDGSRELAKNFGKLPNVVVLSRKEKSGKGEAVKRSISAAKGKVIGYMDIDLSVPLSYLPAAVAKVEEGNKVLIGSRYVKGSDIRRTALRHFLSKGYNLLMLALFGSRVKDHQCGFKFFDGRYAKELARRTKDNHWFFDTEMLVLAQRDGIVPYELPVKWREQKSTKVRKKDIYLFLKAALRFRLGL
ncbi:MAG: glycosyltransferase [Candidatus Micrarchaeaceae archaeon]